MDGRDCDVPAAIEQLRRRDERAHRQRVPLHAGGKRADLLTASRAYARAHIVRCLCRGGLRLKQRLRSQRRSDRRRDHCRGGGCRRRGVGGLRCATKARRRRRQASAAERKSFPGDGYRRERSRHGRRGPHAPWSLEVRGRLPRQRRQPSAIRPVRTAPCAGPPARGWRGELHRGGRAGRRGTMQREGSLIIHESVQGPRGAEPGGEAGGAAGQDVHDAQPGFETA